MLDPNHGTPTALVLGATGFIGGHIAKAAHAAGWRVRGMRRRPGSSGHLAPDTVEWRQGNLDDPAALVSAMEGAELVFHAAAYYPGNGGRVPAQVAYAVGQIRRVLLAARQAGVQRMVYTSTLTTIGLPPPGSERLADERDRYTPGSKPRSAYYECKYAMESEVLRAAARGFPVVVVNPTAVFGPGDVHLTLAGLLIAAARGRMIAWLPAHLNVVDVRDVAQAHLQAARLGEIGARYILGGHNTTLRTLLDLATRLADASPPRFEIPLGLLDLLAVLDRVLPLPGVVSNHLLHLREWQAYDCEQARNVLGLTPRPMEQTIGEALEWLRASGYL